MYIGLLLGVSQVSQALFTFLHSYFQSVPQSQITAIDLSSSMSILSSTNTNLLWSPLINFTLSTSQFIFDLFYNISLLIFSLMRHHPHTFNSLKKVSFNYLSWCIIASLKHLSRKANIRASSGAVDWFLPPCMLVILSCYFACFMFLKKTRQLKYMMCQSWHIQPLIWGSRFSVYLFIDSSELIL